MDIDTRRSLNIFGKLKIPQKIKEHLTSMIPHPTRLIFNTYSRVSLGPIRKSSELNGTYKFVYVLHNDFGYLNQNKITTTNCYSHGINWWMPCILNTKELLKSPLIISSVEEMQKDGIMKDYIIWKAESQ
jgi:hypothetical protein